MKILGIETSCETACSIVEDGRKVLSNVIASQVDIHSATGGVVPEVAAREHVLKMIPVLDECLKKARLGWDGIDAVATTCGPGLISSLIIGTETANVISHVKEKILIPVHHIKGHIYSNWLELDEEIEFPVLVLTISGGHNELILMNGHNEFEVLGESLDDAAGEAFDKVARILGLGYPGGPVISKYAEKGDVSSYEFPRVMLEKDSLDFSFSGLKTAVLNEVKKYVMEKGYKDESEIDEDFKADISASFQEAVVDVLASKIGRVLDRFDVKEVHLAGGVSANLRLREKVKEFLGNRCVLRHPSKISYCTDNAAMIAGAGYFLYQKSPKSFEMCSNIVPTTSFSLF